MLASRIALATAKNSFTVSIGADKSWVTSANTADVYVASVLAADGQGPTDTNLYIVDRNDPGVQVQGRFDGIGLRGNDSAPVRLDVEVSDGARLGDEQQPVVAPGVVVGLGGEVAGQGEGHGALHIFYPGIIDAD